VSHPSKIETGQAYVANGYISLQGKPAHVVDQYFKNSTTIMFVRDPYERLFSAWLDKLYNPNVYFWQSLGNKIRGINNEKVCTHNVTFSEFVEYIGKQIESGKCLDGHFSQSVQHCDPCRFNYTFIGKYETFKEDTIGIVNALNLSTVVTLDNFEEAAADDAINDAATWVFGLKARTTECKVPFWCTLFKTWNRLQSRGIIDMKSKFPFNKTQADFLKQDDFIKSLHAARGTTSDNVLMKNRQLAYQQALMHLSSHIKVSVNKAFMKDFQLFDYSPAKLLNISEIDNPLFQQCTL